MKSMLETFREAFAKTRKWRHDRWESIKADKGAALAMFVAGAVAAYVVPPVVSFFLF